MRVCNTRDGNSSKRVQSIACIEGCAECYENKKLTIFNPAYPTGRFLQCLVDENYQMLIVSQGCSTVGSIPSSYTCSLFEPIPRLDPCTPRKLEVEYDDRHLAEGAISFDEVVNGDEGLPSKVHIPIEEKTFTIRLIELTSAKNT